MFTIVAKESERFTRSYKQRSIAYHLYETMGGLLILIMVGALLVIYTSLSPASAAVIKSSSPVETTDYAADASAFYSAARARLAAAAHRPMNGRDHVEVDFSGNGVRGQIATRGRYRGENGMPKDHNGSDVLVFPRAGLIVYAQPKASIVGVIHPGDVLFRGTISKVSAEGMAYAFKLGCVPKPYAVTMKGDVVEETTATLTGAAPVWDRSSCKIVTFSDNVANAKLTFGWIPGDEVPED